MNAESQYLYLTTTGWKSGAAHEIEIWFVGHGACYYIVAEHSYKAHWVQNIQNNAAITFRLDEVTHQGRGRIVNGETEAELATEIVAKMGAKYGWSDGLVVELCAAPDA